MKLLHVRFNDVHVGGIIILLTGLISVFSFFPSKTSSGHSLLNFRVTYRQAVISVCWQPVFSLRPVTRTSV